MLALVAVSCGAETISSGGELAPTPRPAPTVAGQVIEVDEPEVAAETVFVGISIDDVVEVRALPGLDQPLAGDVSPGTAVEPMGQVFETEDGLVWWQVRAGTIQGWIQPSIAYRGPAVDMTDDVLADLDAAVTFGSAEDASAEIAQMMAEAEGASRVVVVNKTEIEGTGSTTITTDLLGLQDDSVLGYRVIIAAAGSSGWRPASVIRAPLCARGVTPDGLCL